MLSLDSPQWSSLQHAYGSASDIPELLAQLANLRLHRTIRSPGSLCGVRSFAAVPHVIACLATAPDRPDYSFFHLPAWIEVCRLKQGVDVPDDLKPAYEEALSKLPTLMAQAARSTWDESMLTCALAAVAAAKGFGAVAEAILEMNSEVAGEFLKWHLDL